MEDDCRAYLEALGGGWSLSGPNYNPSSLFHFELVVHFERDSVCGFSLGVSLIFLGRKGYWFEKMIATAVGEVGHRQHAAFLSSQTTSARKATSWCLSLGTHH